jgi:hypothetical protein
MLMKVSLQTDAFHYEGAHQQDSTVLQFNVILEPTIKPEGVDGPHVERVDGLYWKATVDVHNGPDDQPLPSGAKGYQARSLGRNPIEALDKLASNLRRVADALDKSLEEGILVPIKLHRKRGDAENPEEDLDSILAEDDS